MIEYIFFGVAVIVLAHIVCAAINRKQFLTITQSALAVLAWPLLVPYIILTISQWSKENVAKRISKKSC
jgi:hypothetical protein